MELHLLLLAYSFHSLEILVNSSFPPHFYTEAIIFSCGFFIFVVVSVEKGCRRSRVNLLRLYTAASTVVMVLSVFSAVRSRLTMEVICLSQTYFAFIVRLKADKSFLLLVGTNW